MRSVTGCGSRTAARRPAWATWTGPTSPSGSPTRPSAQVNRGELDGQKAFTQGKVKIGGKMLKMMQLRGPLAQVQAALAGIDTEY